ncbi:MAG: tetratricopeptide repeat protein [Candidatus Kariarchaeaceae archaeon]|jgi:tetratricopeptide (TPR) repeat protein
MDLSLIHKLIDEGSYNDAIKLLSKIDKKSIEAVTLESLVLREMGNYDKSLTVIGKLFRDKSFKLYDDSDRISKDYIDAKSQELYTKWRNGDFAESMETCREIIPELEKNELDDSLKFALASLYNIKGNIHSNLGEYLENLDDHKKAAAIYEELKVDRSIALISNNIGYTYLLMGEINLSEEYLIRSLDLGEKNKKQDYARALSNYGILLTQKGEFNNAHEYFRQALQIQKQIGNRSETAYTLFELITLTILMGNTDEAQSLLDELRSEFEQFPHEYVSVLYELAVALVKKSGNRFKLKLEATNILQKIIDKPPFSIHHYVLAMKLLCEILLEELQIYENAEILDEINNIVTKLEEMGQSKGSSWVLNEALLLKSKLYLIENRVPEAIDTLLESKKIAEQKGLTNLAHHITNVYNDLKYQLGFWEELDQRQASLKERVEQSDIIDLVQSLQSKSLTYQIKETEIPIMMLIINSGGLVKLRYKFGNIEGLHEHLIGGFLSAINSFFTDVFTEKNSLDRIRSKDYTILLRSTEEYLFCYIFKGQSLFAAQKLESFVQEIIIRDDILRRFGSPKDVITPNISDPYNILPIISKYFLNGKNAT